MDENDLSIEKREPGFFASLFGAEPETVLVNSDGDVVGKIETEEPGFFGSLMGVESKQVIVNSDGDKVATFENEEPGFLGSLMGETVKTVLVDAEGEKLASFDKEEPGVVGGLLGEKAKTVLLDPNGDKLATFGREEPGFIGQLLGEKSKQLIQAEAGRIAEIHRRLSPPNKQADSNYDDATRYFDDNSQILPRNEQDAKVNLPVTPALTVIAENADESVYLTAGGQIVIHTRIRTIGTTLTTTEILTLSSSEEYENLLEMRKALLEIFKRDHQAEVRRIAELHRRLSPPNSTRYYDSDFQTRTCYADDNSANSPNYLNLIAIAENADESVFMTTDGEIQVHTHRTEKSSRGLPLLTTDILALSSVEYENHLELRKQVLEIIEPYNGLLSDAGRLAENIRVIARRDKHREAEQLSKVKNYFRK